MASTGTTPAELLIDINSTIRVQTGANTITPTTHSALLDNMVKVLSGSSDTNGVIYVDADTGVDSGATIGSPQTAFKTIKAARDYAVASGYTGTTSLIYVQKGAYSGESYLTYDGNYYFEEGAVVTGFQGSDAGGTRESMFAAGYGDYPSTLTEMNIFGNGEFIIPASTDVGSNGWSASLLNSSVAGANIYFECKKIVGYSAFLINAGGNSGATLTVNVKDSIESLQAVGSSNIPNYYTIRVIGANFTLNTPKFLEQKVSGGNCSALNFRALHGEYTNINIDNFLVDTTYEAIRVREDSVSTYDYVPVININIKTLRGGYRGITPVDGWYEHVVWNINIDNMYVSDYGVVASVTDGGNGPVNFNYKGNITSGNRSIYLSNSNPNSTFIFDGHFTSTGETETVYLNANTSDTKFIVNGVIETQATGTTISSINVIDTTDSFGIGGLGSVQVYGNGPSIKGATTVNLLGNTYFEQAPDTATTVTGNYVLSGKTHVNELNLKNIGSGTSLTNLGIDSSGNVVSGTTAVLTFKANLFQNGASNPPIFNAIFQDDLGVVSTNYQGVGEYELVFPANTFPDADKVFILMGVGNDAGDLPLFATLVISDTTIRITNTISGALDDNALSNTSIFVEVYP